MKLPIYFAVMLSVLSSQVVWSLANDPYLDWLAFERSFQGQRQLTTEDKHWLSQLANNNAYVEVPAIRLPAVLDFGLAPAERTFRPTPSLNAAKPDVFFYAPKKPLTQSRLNNGIVIEQSGQAVMLPVLDSLADVDADFLAVLRSWLSRDLTALVQRLQSMQQETGWSDAELVQLMVLYGTTLFEGSEQDAFLAAFWRQAGFDVQLSPLNDEWILLIRAQPVDDKTLFKLAQHYWLPLREVSAGRLALLPETAAAHGQALRWVSINDRSSTSVFTPVQWSFASATNTTRVGLELPAHWARINRRAGDLVSRFNEQLPDYLFRQIHSMLEPGSSRMQTRQFADWLTVEFADSGYPVSVQQGLFSGELSMEARFIALAWWWRQLTRQNIALIAQSSGPVLALQLPAAADDSETVSYRGQQWWLWRDGFLTDTDAVQSGQWLFLP